MPLFLLKGGPTASCRLSLLPRQVNWNPGLSLYVKDGVPFPDAAPLALPPGDPSAAGSSLQPEAASAGLSAGQIAGIVVGALAGSAAAAGGIALWWRRRRQQRASSSTQQLLPAHALAPAGSAALKARASLPSELPEVYVDGGGEVELASSVRQPGSTPRHRPQNSPPGRGSSQQLPPPPLLPAAAGQGSLAVTVVSLADPASTVPRSPFADLATKVAPPASHSSAAGSSSGHLTVAALVAGGSSTVPLLQQLGGRPPATAAASGTGGGSNEASSLERTATASSQPEGSAADEAASSGAKAAGQRSQALAFVDEWEDVLVRRREGGSEGGRDWPAGRARRQALHATWVCSAHEAQLMPRRQACKHARAQSLLLSISLPRCLRATSSSRGTRRAAPSR